LQASLAERKVTLSLAPAARSELARRGWDPLFGARPLGRLIETEIGNVLAEEMLFGRLTSGGRVRIGLMAGQLTFNFGG
jgi:ATP-dependent Clp protease ATP-binding subunit ClpA